MSIVVWMIFRTNCICMVGRRCVFECAASNRMCHWILCRRMCTDSVLYPNDISCDDWVAAAIGMISSIDGIGICSHRLDHYFQTATFYHHQSGCDVFEYCQQPMDFWNHDHHLRIPIELLVAIPTIFSKKKKNKEINLLKISLNRNMVFFLHKRSTIQDVVVLNTDCTLEAYKSDCDYQERCV